MSQSNIHDPLWSEKVTLPVRWVDGRWEFFYGGAIPVDEGSIGDLTLDLHLIVDKKFKQRVTQQIAVHVLNEGTPLLVALSAPNAKQSSTHWPPSLRNKLPWGTTRLEKITLGPAAPKRKKLVEGEKPAPGGLTLKLKGLDRCELQSSTVMLPPGLDVSSASSLNHAFTLLSRAYETHRISNTGNVYTRMFYEDNNGHWYPLDDLRHGVQASAEQTLLNSAWAEIEKQLGWRPMLRTKPARRRSSPDADQ